MAALLAAALLLYARERTPARRYWGSICVVVVGVVVGFRLFTALAFRELSSAHSAVIVGLLPTATAGMAVLRAGERPSRAFWFSCGFGLISVLLFAAVEGDGRPRSADLLVLVAVLLCSAGYAESGALAREIGGWRVISWAPIFAAPLLLPVVLYALWTSGISEGLSGGAEAWLAFGYLSVVSMFLGFFA